MPLPVLAKPGIPVLTIGMLSSLGLGYEVLLMRLFSITQWHHFAYMIISIALLGYGASGAFLTIVQNWANRHFHTLFLGNIILFGFSSFTCFVIGQTIPFNPLELFWDPSQWIWLLTLYLLLIIPFFCVANCIALTFSFRKKNINRIYAADLTGAALGSLGIVFLLRWFFPEQVLSVMASLSMLAALLAIYELSLPRQWMVLIIAVATLPWLLPERWTTLSPSEYKPLSQTLNIMGARAIDQRSSPLGLLTVVESLRIPFRHAAGLSLSASQPPPEQLAIFTDGGAMTTINRYSSDNRSINFVDQMTSALPYQLLQQPSVLVLGAGGGTEVLQGLFHKASFIEAVELNPQIVDLVRKDNGVFSGQIYDNEKVNIHTAEARGFLTATTKQFDLIQISLMDSFGAASAGLTSLSEDYLYTVEALDIYLNHLNPEGILAFTRWVKIPPRDTLKLVATARMALQQQGVAKPEDHLALIRTWNTATLLIKKQALNAEDINLIKHFSEQRNFDLAYYPGINKSEVNRFNILASPYFYTGSTSLLSPQYHKFMEQYKYDLEPATDDRPYFFHFLKLNTLPEILGMPASQGMLLIEWGTIILLVTLLQAGVASAILILLPLWLYQRSHRPQAENGLRIFVFSYFFIIGLAFMFVEMAFIQKFGLFLSHPIYAFAVVICAFLLFAGMGSSLSTRLPGKYSMILSITGILIFTLVYIFVLPTLFSSLLSAAFWIKVIVSLMLIAPLAFFMGMPFPIALSFVAKTAPHHIPWAWGVNGCASVISAVFATLLAIQFGFTAVILAALVLYLAACLLFLWQSRQRTAAFA